MHQIIIICQQPSQQINQVEQTKPLILFIQKKTHNEKKIYKNNVICNFNFNFFFAIWYLLQKQESRNYQKEGNLLINKIETFRQIEKRLPDNLTDLGIEDPMNSGPYYEKKDSVNYIVFFAVGFDETYIYYSDKKAWKTEH